MAIAHYLAMTAEEITSHPLPVHPAWMACHFSPYSTGLTNLPEKPPEGCLLILNDRIPIRRHSPERIASELQDIMEKYSCPGLLLDFQNPGSSEAVALVEKLTEAMPDQLIISEPYAHENCAILLPPLPTDVLPEDYLVPWKGRKVWLETALEGQTITLTKDGAAFAPNREILPDSHTDEKLHCHYTIREAENSMIFRTWRTAEDLHELLREAEALGAAGAVGLYQEIHS